MAFRNHLGAYEKVKLAVMKCTQHPFKVVSPAHRVAVQSADSCLRKHAVQQFLQLFRSRSQEISVLAAAVHAMLGNRRNETAVVTLHFSRALVMGQRNGAVPAFERFAAGAT